MVGGLRSRRRPKGGRLADEAYLAMAGYARKGIEELFLLWQDEDQPVSDNRR